MKYKIWELLEKSKSGRLIEEIEADDLVDAVKQAKVKFPKLGLRVSNDKFAVEFPADVGPLDETKLRSITGELKV
jgi:hypothetical protein